MLRNTLIITGLAVFALLGNSTANAQLSISSGVNSYAWDLSTNGANADFTTLDGDVMSQENWLFRYQVGGFGAGTKVAYLNDSTTTAGVTYLGTVNSGDSAVSTWRVVDEFEGDAYQVVINHLISDIGPGDALLEYSIAVTNTGGGTSVTGSNFSIFNYFDYDIDGFDNDEITIGFIGGDVHADMQDTPSGIRAVRNGIGANGFEAREWAAGGANIDDSIAGSTSYNLTNSGTTTNDITAAMQWNGVMGAANTTVTFFGDASSVPEPGSLALLSMLGLVGACMNRRRRA